MGSSTNNALNPIWQDIVHDGCLVFCVMAAAMVPILALERAKRIDNKGVSYGLSLVCSLSMTVAGFTALPAFPHSGFDVTASLIDTRYDRFICTFFGSFCCVDILFGLVFYPKQIDLLTGATHHVAYLWLMWYLHVNHIQGGFRLFLVEELPTFLLAVGNVSKAWRTNVLFGLAFFCTRIVWHSFLLTKFWAIRSTRNVWMFILLALILHLQWFAGFMKQQRRRRGSSKPKSN